MKDILVDANVAKTFCNPMDPEYKKLIDWLFNDGSLVVTKQLLGRYAASTGGSEAPTNILVVIGHQQADGRLNIVSNKQLRGFTFGKAASRKLKCNNEDRALLKAVILSFRRLALTRDKNFHSDVNNYPGVNARAAFRPRDLPYAG